MIKAFYQKFKAHYVSNLSLAIPVVISQLGHTLVHTADSIIVGQFAGTFALAAVSLVNSIFMVIMMIGIGLSYGLTPLIAQENGKQNYIECGKLLVNSLIINLVFGVLLYAIMYIGSVFVMTHLQQQAEVVTQAKPYLKLLSISIIPLMVFLTFKQFAEGLGFTKQAMIITISGNVLNVMIGLTLVQGLFGFTALGISGVGYSTLIDRCLMAIVMCFYVLKSNRFKKYLTEFFKFKIRIHQVKQILKLGAPTALQYTFEVSAFSGAAIIVGTIGAVELAAHQVALNLASTTYMMASGIAAAATIKIGNSVGENNYKNLRLSAISSYHIVLLFMGLMAVLFVVFNKYLPMLFSSDVSVVHIAEGLLLIAAVFQLFDGAQVVGLGILRGMGDVNIPTLITFLAYWVLGLPVGYVLAITLNLGVYGVWIGLSLGLLVTAILLFFRFNWLSKKLSNA